MENLDFSLRGKVTVLKPKRDKDDKVVRNKKDAIIKEEHEVDGYVRGRIVISADFLAIVNERGEEVGRVVLTDGELDLVEGEADPDKRVRMGIAGGIPTVLAPEHQPAAVAAAAEGAAPVANGALGTDERELPKE